MKRDSRLTADITPEAHDMLRSLVLKHERGKGWFVEKMIRKFSIDTPVEEKINISRSKAKTYPSNFDDQFELLWCAKGKKGAKQKAKVIYKKLAEGETNEVMETFTKTLMDDLIKKQHEPGYEARHLTSYLNGEFWEE